MGKQEIGETTTQCAARETHEETGVTVKITGLLGIFSDPGHIVLYHSNGETRQSTRSSSSANQSPATPPPTTRHPPPAGTHATNYPDSTSTPAAAANSATG